MGDGPPCQPVSNHDVVVGTLQAWSGGQTLLRFASSTELLLAMQLQVCCEGYLD